jgi:hypothetical protein
MCTFIATGNLVLKWNLEDHVSMAGQATSRILGLIEMLEEEGLL